MATYTVGCVSEDCGWEDDREYRDLKEAVEELEVECCPGCESDLKIVN
jgi:hypothetical protein